MSKEKTDTKESNSRIEDKVLENMIVLQKVHTDLAEKFDKLTKEISHLLALFELAARNFSKQTEKVSGPDKEFLDKIDKLLEQNKTIAKGLTLMEEQVRGKAYSSIEKEEKVEALPQQEYALTTKTNRPLPKF